ncbi:MAG TPA: PEP-CTERM sorting domain-containing protein [Planctomycetota bacterium]|nr:PEP-CTERM sorting domain-containing protein [Planctomycetota bacterium]
MRRVLGKRASVLRLAVLVVAAVLMTGVIRADEVVTFEPDPEDLYELPHDKYFTWGIEVPGDFTMFPVTSAVLTFTDIRNWDDSTNQLYVHLMDHAPLGVRSFNDGGGDALAGEGILLVEYFNLSSSAQTLVYGFSTEQLATLNSYLVNGNNMALGFDPDCHFYNEGVSLDLTQSTSEVPEPGTMALVGTALAGLVGFVRRKRIV